MKRECLNKIIFIIILLFLILPSCKAPIDSECFDYFKSLENKKFWTKNWLNVELINEENKREVILENNNPLEEMWLNFLNIEILDKNKNDLPIKAVISLISYDGINKKNFSVKICFENRKILEEVLNNMETDEIRNERLLNEKYLKTINEGEKYLDEDKITLAIEKFLEAKNIKDTQEVNYLLDKAYYERGEYYFSIDEMEKAKDDLLKIQNDKNCMEKAKILLDKIQKSENERLARLDKNVQKSYEEFKKIYFYKHVLEDKTFEQKDISIFPYLGATETEKWFFLRLRLYSSFSLGRLFAQQIRVIIDDKSYKTPIYDTLNPNVINDIWSYGVYERIDFKDSDKEVEELVTAVINAPLGTPIKFRIYGTKYYIDYTLSKEEHLAWKDIMYYYYNILKQTVFETQET